MYNINIENYIWEGKKMKLKIESSIKQVVVLFLVAVMAWMFFVYGEATAKDTTYKIVATVMAIIFSAITFASAYLLPKKREE